MVRPERRRKKKKKSQGPERSETKAGRATNWSDVGNCPIISNSVIVLGEKGPTGTITRLTHGQSMKCDCYWAGLSTGTKPGRQVSR